MEKSKIFAMVTFSLAVVIAVLSIIAIATPSWRILSPTSPVLTTTRKFGLFEGCVTIASLPTTCSRFKTDEVADYFLAVRAFMVMGVILALVEIPLTALLFYGKLKRGNIIAAGIIGLAGIFFLIGCSVFTAKQRKLIPPQYTEMKFGYSFGLAWTSTILALIAIPFALISKTGSGSGYDAI